MNKTSMHLLPFLLGVSALSLLIATEAGATKNEGDAGASSIPACVQVSTESRYVPYGYNHIVILTNGCTKAVSCTVSTDVNPEKQKVDVPAGTKIEVATFLGAATAVFKPNVACR